MKDKLAIAAIIIIGLSIGGCANYVTSEDGIKYIFGQYK